MAEAFIMGGGGGATIQHITATDAKSLTFSLTNPKRSKCLVFGVYEYSVTSYNGLGQTSSVTTYRCGLAGTVFDRVRTIYSYDNGGTTYQIEKNVSSGFFTRNANNITLTIGYAAGGVIEAMGTVYKNNIDIYVVDYD